MQTAKWGAANRFHISYDENVFLVAYESTHPQEGTTAATCSPNVTEEPGEQGEIDYDEEQPALTKTQNRNIHRKQKKIRNKLVDPYITTQNQ